MTAASDDYDTPWKDAVTRYFPEFMAFYFPQAHAEIDWLRPHVFLEQELAQVARDAELGKRRVDKLVRVSKRHGVDEWLLVHIDVQGRRDRDFAERMFVYNYRIYDRFRRPVASLAVLADGRAGWRPDRFVYSVLGCETGIRFPLVKLSDYGGRTEALLREPNVFGLVTAAHLLTQQSKGKDVQRHEAKWKLVKLLYQRNWTRQRVIDLFNVIDWMMRIPPELQSRLKHDLEELERSHNMPYMSSFERAGLERGLKEGREEGRKEGRKEGRVEGQKEGQKEGRALMLQEILEQRFGALPEGARQRIARADGETLASWGKTAIDAPSLDAVFAAVAP